MKGKLLSVEEVVNIKTSEKKYYVTSSNSNIPEGIYTNTEGTQLRDGGNLNRFSKNCYAVEKGDIKVYEYEEENIIKGRKLSIEEIRGLENGTKVWLEKGKDLEEGYNRESKVYEVKNGFFCCNIEEGVKGIIKIWTDGIAVKSGKIEVYEWKEESEVKEYKGWEILKMIDDGELKTNDKVIVNDDFEFYVSVTGVLRYSSDKSEVYSSYFKGNNKYTILKQESVSFEEATQAFLDGKNVRCEYPGFSSGKKHITEFHQSSERDKGLMVDGEDLSFHMIKTGKWYIND